VTTTQNQPAGPSSPRQCASTTLARILGTWAAAALPMAALAWLVAPRLAAALNGPTALPRALILSLLAGLIWQFLLVVLLVYREQGTLRWSVVKDALWLHAPRSPKTGRRGGRLWLIVIPLIAALAVEELLPNLPTPRPATWACSSGRTPVRRSCRATGPGWPSSCYGRSSTPCWVRKSCSVGCCHG
jgi:hypothetical protein